MLLFVSSLKTVGEAIVKIFFLGFLGFLLGKIRFLSRQGLDEMSKLVIYVTLPALIFYNFLTKFDASKIRYWWILPIGGFALSVFGLAIGWLISYFLKRNERKQFASLLGLQNAGYLPLVLSASLLGPSLEELAFIHVFFVMTGMSTVMWSAGVFLISGSTLSNFKSLKNILSPPMIAIALSVTLVLTGWRIHVPNMLKETANFAGKITIPLIMIILGGTLSRTKTKEKIRWRGISLLIFLKSIVFPALALGVCFFFRPPEVLAFVLILETASPPATNLVVIGKHYGKNTLFLNQGLLYTYLASIITLPVTISVLNLFY